MNELIGLLSAELGCHWEWLAGSSIKVTAWLLLVLVVLQPIRKASASWRHLTAVCGAVGIPLIFLLNLSLIPDQFEWRPFAKEPVEQVDLKMIGVAQDEAQNASFLLPVPSATNDATSRNSFGSIDVRTGIVALWWLGCFVVGIRFLLRLRRPNPSLLSDAPAELKQVLKCECARMSIQTIPTLQTAPDAMPMVHGITQAGIILPTTATDWPSEKLTSVLRHELTHLQRRDVCWSMIVEVALLPVWWHPLARILRCKTLEWTEQACDDSVIASGIVPTRYATDLLSLSPGNAVVPAPAYGLAAVSKRGQKARFRRLLDENVSRLPVTSRKVAWTVLMALGLLVPATLLVSCSTAPKKTDAQTMSVAVGSSSKIPTVASDARKIRLSAKFFEIDFPSDRDRKEPGVSDWLDGKTKILSSEHGSQLFDDRKPVSKTLSCPQVVSKPGSKTTLEIVRDVALSNKEEPAFAKVGIILDFQVWPTDETDTLRVKVTSSETKVIGYEPDETGFKVPQIHHLKGSHEGKFQNGGYLLIDLCTRSGIPSPVPPMDAGPLIKPLFCICKTRSERKLIAARLIFSEAP